VLAPRHDLVPIGPALAEALRAFGHEVAHHVVPGERPAGEGVALLPAGAGIEGLGDDQHGLLGRRDSVARAVGEQKRVARHGPHGPEPRQRAEPER
jgi:hypothetical protein